MASIASAAVGFIGGDDDVAAMMATTIAIPSAIRQHMYATS
jgi:hypothetical protein